MFKKFALFSAALFLSFSILAFPSGPGEEGPDDGFPPPTDEGPGDGYGWAPETRWVIHPTTGLFTELKLKQELEDVAYYEPKTLPTPPIQSACTVNPALCVLIRHGAE